MTKSSLWALAAFLLAITMCHTLGGDVAHVRGQKASAIGLANLDFEQGKAPWQAWHSDSAYFKGPFPWDIDAAVVRSGKASLRIEAKSPYARIMVHQETDRFARGARYQVSYWIKVSAADMLEGCDLVVSFRKPKADGKGSDLTQVVPTMLSPGPVNGWWLRRGVFTVPKDAASLQIALRVHHTMGTAWFDDIRLTEQKPGDIRGTGIHDYAPEQVEQGQAMVDRFNKLAAARSPFLERAKVLNQLLVETAQIAEESRRLERCAFYAKAERDVAGEVKAITQAEEQLDKLHQTYARLFLARKDKELEQFDGQAKAFKKSLGPLRLMIASKIESLQKAALASGQKWTAPAAPASKPIAMSPQGKPDQLIFGSVSLGSHYELEEPLGVNRLHHVGIFEAKGGPGKYDFSDLFVNWKFMKGRGVTHMSIGTALAVHSNQMAPAWFLKKYKDDPDIFMVGADGSKALRPDWSSGAPLNTWRPEVREMTADFLAQLGKAFRDQPQYLWYVIAPENGGPYFPSERDNRATGYNRSALSDFHAWLKKRYGSVDRLNKAWQTKHARFEDVKPPDDLLMVNEWKRPHPAAYEFQSWRLDHHHNWLKFLYDNLKKADPNHAVMADHSALLSQVDGSRIFDTADILSYHHDRDYKTMLGLIYLHSMNRFAKKHLGLHENMWGSQDAPITSNERTQRAILTKYLYRLTTWGMHSQMWWYAYTGNDYMVQYNGNWFDPVTDLTTLRYSAAGLPVAKASVQRLQHVLLDAKIVPARVALIQPQTSMLFQNYWNESYLEMEEIHKLLYGHSHLYELLPETYFSAGRAKLDDFDVVILPYAPYFPDKLGGQLRDWVKKGGLLIGAGPFGLYDKFGFDKAEPWRDLFGTKAPERATPAYPYWDHHRMWRWTMADAKDDFLEKSAGKGKVLVTLRTLRDRDFRVGVAPKLLAALDAKAPRPARCASHAFEMTLQQTPDGKKYLCVINGKVDRPVQDTITLAGEFKSATDLDIPGGFPIPLRRAGGETTFDLRLQAGAFALIALE